MAEPAKKRIKGEDTKRSSTEDLLQQYRDKRKAVCESVADFKFNKKRVRLVSSQTEMLTSCRGIVYWMWRDQRVQGLLSSLSNFVGLRLALFFFLEFSARICALKS